MELNERWMLRKEAAEYVGLSVSSLAHMACSGKGPRYYRTGKLTRYLKSDLDDWVRRQYLGPPHSWTRSYAGGRIVPD